MPDLADLFPDGGIDPVRGKSGKEVGEIRHGLLATAIGGYDNNLLLPLDCAPADIAAAEAVRPADAVDRCIGAALRFAHGFAARADIKHKAPVREDALAVRLGAGVEEFSTLGLCRRIEAFDDRAFIVVSGIAFCRHHD